MALALMKFGSARVVRAKAVAADAVVAAVLKAKVRGILNGGPPAGRPGRGSDQATVSQKPDRIRGLAAAAANRRSIARRSSRIR